MTEGESVTLNTDRAVIKDHDVIRWRFWDDDKS